MMVGVPLQARFVVSPPYLVYRNIYYIFFSILLDYV